MNAIPHLTLSWTRDLRTTFLASRTLLAIALVLVLVLPWPIGAAHAQCKGLCGDVNSNGNITPYDLVALDPYLRYAESTGVEMECANVDGHAGVSMRDHVLITWNTWTGFPLNCQIDSGPFVPPIHPGYFLHYNTVFPAGDTVVTLYIDATLGGQDFTWAVSVVVRVWIDGEIPVLTEVTPTAPSSGFDKWEVRGFSGPGAGNIPAGYLMGDFWTTDFGCPGPGRYPLGRANVNMPASVQPRIITLELAEFPPGANMTMAHDGIPADTDAWAFNLAPWIIDLTGDVNNDRVITAADIIGMVNYVFKGGALPYPLAASGDVNCSGSVNSADIIELVNFVFKGGSAPCNVATDCTITVDSWICP